MIVLREGFDDASLRVNNSQAMLPLGVRAHDAFSFHPVLRPILRVLARSSRAWQRRYGRVAPRQPADRINETRPEIRNELRFRSFDVGEFAAKKQKDSIRIF